MHDRVNELMDRIASQAKQKAGELLETSRLEREDQAKALSAHASQQADEPAEMTQTDQHLAQSET